MLAILLTLTSFFSSSGIDASSQTGLTPDSVRYFPVKTDSTARYLQINRIFILGNKLTRDRIILRELSLHTGDIIYSVDLPEILEKDRKKLYNTRLFNTVEIRTIELIQDKVDLLIDLDERWYTFPSPIFELSDRNFNEWWQNYNHDLRRVNYGLRLYQFNMRGRNETLRATMQFGFQRIFSIVYRIPYIDKKQKHGLVIDMDFQESKNLAYRTFDHKLEYLKSRDLLRETRGIGLTYTYRNSFYDIHAINVGYRESSIADTIMDLNSNYLGNENINQRVISLSYRFTSDHRDVFAYPLTGSYFLAEATKYGLGFGLDVNKTELILSYSRFVDLKKKFYFSNYSYGYWSSPENQPYNQYGALGYKKQLVRGYEVYVIEGPMYFLNKTTLKKQLFSHVYRWEAWPIEQFRHIPIAIYAKTYADFGFVKNYPGYTNNTRLTDRLLMGMGAGFDIVSSYDLVLRLEYTINHEGNHGFFFNVRKEF